MNIDIIINNLELKYYTSITNTLNKNNIENKWLENHINKLNGILITDTEIIKKNDLLYEKLKSVLYRIYSR